MDASSREPPFRKNPPYRILTHRLELRCWSPREAAPLMEAIAANLDHLRPWMPWARHEPEPVHAKAARIRKWRALFDRGEDFFLGIFEPESVRVVGGIGSHSRIGAGAREIGYWVRADRVRQGLATEAAAALVRVGFELEKLRRIEIHCDTRNVASAGVPRTLGFVHELTIAKRVRAASQEARDAAVWSLTRDRYSASRAAAFPIEVFDAVGGRLM